MKCPNDRDKVFWYGFVLYIQEQSLLSNFLIHATFLLPDKSCIKTVQNVNKKKEK